MSKLSISVDMGAKNNGVFIAKVDNNSINEKKAINIVFDEKSITPSFTNEKKSLENLNKLLIELKTKIY